MGRRRVGALQYRSDGSLVTGARGPAPCAGNHPRLRVVPRADPNHRHPRRAAPARGAPMHRTRRIAIAIAATAVAAAWYAFRPERLFVDQVVDEQLDAGALSLAAADSAMGAPP